MRLVLSAGLMAILAIPAMGQDDNVGAAARGAACSLIADSLSRLTCFDKAFPSKPDVGTDEKTGTAPQASDLSSWNVEVSKSAIDDSQQVIAILLPTKASGSGVGDSDAALLLRCSENTTSAILSTSMFMTEDDVPVTIRIGDAPATKSLWSLSTTYKSVGLWSGAKAIPFIRSLPDNTRLVVRIEERNRLDAEFNLGEVSKVADQIGRACNWPKT